MTHSKAAIVYFICEVLRVDVTQSRLINVPTTCIKMLTATHSITPV